MQEMVLLLTSCEKYASNAQPSVNWDDAKSPNVLSTLNVKDRSRFQQLLSPKLLSASTPSLPFSPMSVGTDDASAAMPTEGIWDKRKRKRKKKSEPNLVIFHECHLLLRSFDIIVDFQRLAQDMALRRQPAPLEQASGPPMLALVIFLDQHHIMWSVCRL